MAGLGVSPYWGQKPATHTDKAPRDGAQGVYGRSSERLALEAWMVVEELAASGSGSMHGIRQPARPGSGRSRHQDLSLLNPTRGSAEVGADRGEIVVIG